VTNEEQLIAECIKTTTDYPNCQETCPFDLLTCDTIYPVVTEEMVANDVEEILDNMTHDKAVVVTDEAMERAKNLVAKINAKCNLGLSEDKQAELANSIATTFAHDELPKDDNAFFGSVINHILEGKVAWIMQKISEWEKMAQEGIELPEGQELEWVKIDATDAINHWTPELITFGVMCFFYGLGYGKTSR